MSATTWLLLATTASGQQTLLGPGWGDARAAAQAAQSHPLRQQQGYEVVACEVVPAVLARSALTEMAHGGGLGHGPAVRRLCEVVQWPPPAGRYSAWPRPAYEREDDDYVPPPAVPATQCLPATCPLPDAEEGGP